MCTAKTAQRRRRQMKLDSRYKGWRKDATVLSVKSQAKIAAAKRRESGKK